MTDHPITPPPELVRHWSRFQGDTNPEALWFRIANEAAQWGADTELDACCHWVDANFGQRFAQQLRLLHRPQPSSLKEQALSILDDASDQLDAAHENILRRALEALDD
jgi:hypothetical protein